MKLHKLNKIALSVSMVVLPVVLFGCVASESNVHYKGIEKSHLRQIERGMTTRDELLAIVGKPTEQRTTEDGTEVLRYQCKETKDSSFAMFPPPIAIEDKKEKEYIARIADFEGLFAHRDSVEKRFK